MYIVIHVPLSIRYYNYLQGKYRNEHDIKTRNNKVKQHGLLSTSTTAATTSTIYNDYSSNKMTITTTMTTTSTCDNDNSSIRNNQHQQNQQTAIIESSTTTAISTTYWDLKNNHNTNNSNLWQIKNVISNIINSTGASQNRGGGVAQWVARLTRDQWIPASRELEPR